MNLSLFLKLLFGSIGVIGVLIAARAFYLNFLSKPKTKREAEKLLTKLNAKEHKIYSSVCISKKGKKNFKK